MGKNTWFRFSSDFIDDPRLGTLSDSWQMACIRLMNAEINQGLANSDEEIANQISLQVSEWAELKSYLSQKGMLIIGNECKTNFYGPLVFGDDRPPANEWKKLRKSVFQRDNYTCQYCGIHGVELQCDHVHPISRGGSNDLNNLVTACRQCNLGKRDKTVAEWLGGES